jgi:hypothetical protein
MLWIELTKVDKLEHKIDFKLFFLSKTACANTTKIWFLSMFGFEILYCCQTNNEY